MRFLALLLAALLPSAASASLQKGIIEVGIVKGTSTLKDSGGRSANLTKGLTFKEGHRVETAANSTVELIFSNGATILVNPETQIEVKIFSQVASPLIIAGKYKELSAEPSMSIVQIELYRGKIIGEARKLNPSTQFTVKTPVGLTRVRGTVWTDEYTYDDTTQTGTQTTTVVKGEVEVNDLQGSLPTPIIGGQEIIITGPAEKPVRDPEDEDLPSEPSPGLPSESKTEVKPADPEKVEDVVDTFTGGTTSPPPPPGGTEPGTGPTDPGTGGTDPSAPAPEDEKPKTTPPPPTPPPPPPPLPPELDSIIEKETQQNLSPAGSTN